MAGQIVEASLPALLSWSEGLDASEAGEDPHFAGVVLGLKRQNVIT